MSEPQKYSFKNLNEIIDWWISKKLAKSIDSAFAKSFYQSEYSKFNSFANNINGSLIHQKNFQKVYQKYRLGEFAYTDRIFNHDDLFIELLTPEQMKICLDEKLIVQVTQKFKSDKKRQRIKGSYQPPVFKKYTIDDKSIIKELFRAYRLQIFCLETERKLKPNFDVQTEIAANAVSKIPKQVQDIIPIFKTEVIDTILDILKDFFKSEEQPELEQLLRTGYCNRRPLLFRSNGNRLCDAFKQLYEGRFIAGCQKKELENWIGNNFIYLRRSEIKKFKLRYLNDIISTNKDLCRNPLLSVEKDKQTGKYCIIGT